MGTTSRRTRNSPTFRAQNIPSPISTNDDSDDDLQKNTSLDESFTEDGDLLGEKSGMGTHSFYGLTCLVLVLSLLFATQGGPMYINKLLISREVRAREARESKAHEEEINRKKTVHKGHEMPATVVTKTSSMNDGLIEFSVSGGEAAEASRPIMLYLSGSDGEEFSNAANQVGYIFGLPVGAQTYWGKESPVPSNPGSITNVLKSLNTICSQVPADRPSCSINSDKVYVAGSTDFGFHAFKVDVNKDHWEEIRIPGLAGGSWEDRLLWLQ
ncbi:hypothetical protein TrVE_jg4840 [Triparma verrucosa]|uniref:Uncharacterized protein n=2 Tax=Triparma TaxID=722752 RepID=A0A9W7B1Q5_9STRA|nr:hypothetical protein TrST_g12528 [Triparma strigata]GMH96197.1 hypothetical protein TrVE_jg4840 [Triparma verrucosa]